jgi:hypothetical protein
LSWAKAPAEARSVPRASADAPPFNDAWSLLASAVCAP